jgi:hypothetical protein
MPAYPHLKTIGDYGLTVSVALDEIGADYGDGYDASVLTGDARGLLSWALKYQTLPGAAADLPINDAAQADYLWDFFLARKAAGNESFTVRDPRSGNIYLVKFAESNLSYEMVLCKLWSTGLKLQQRREVVGNIFQRAKYWYESDWLNLGDGDLVARLDEGNHAALSPLLQATEALQPTFNLYGWGSTPAPTILFTGGRRLSASANYTGGAVTAFLVGVAAGYDQHFFELGTGSGNTGLLLYTETTNKLVAAAYRSGTGHYAVKNSFTAGVPHLYTIRANATNLKLWIDGVLVATTAGDAHLGSWSNLTMGANNSNNSPLTGDIATLAIFQEDMSDADLALMNAKILAGAGT